MLLLLSVLASLSFSGEAMAAEVLSHDDQGRTIRFDVSVEGVDVSKAYDFLWTKYRIITAAIKHAEYQGLRVTPNVYTTLEEVDTFAAAIEDLLRNPPSTAA